MIRKRFKLSQFAIILVVSIFALLCLIPFIMVISGSLSTEQDIMNYGYTIIPKHPTLLAYRLLMFDSSRILDAYKVSISVTVIGTVLSLLVNTMAAYVMSRRNLKYRKFISVYCLITLLFSGGLVPWYIVCVNYLHLKNTLFAMILPPVAGAFYMFLIRNYLMTIPEEMYESAKIDGAGEFRIFFQIILPLAKPVLATVCLFSALGYWNDWFLGLMLVDKRELWPLQLILRATINEFTVVMSSANSTEMRRIASMIPAEGIKMAVCVITIGPIVLLYPFLQKYFIKGIMIGAVKA